LIPSLFSILLTTTITTVRTTKYRVSIIVDITQLELRSTRLPLHLKLRPTEQDVVTFVGVPGRLPSTYSDLSGNSTLSRSTLRSPVRPPHSYIWFPSEQFQICSVRIHFFNYSVNLFRLLAVLTYRRCQHRGRPVLLKRHGHGPLLADQKKLVLSPDIVPCPELASPRPCWFYT